MAELARASGTASASATEPKPRTAPTRTLPPQRWLLATPHPEESASLARDARLPLVLAELLVARGNCRFIYCGLSNGSIIDGYGNRAATLLASGLFTGMLDIENNITSFIHVGLRAPTSYASPPPSIIIRGNRLFGADNSSSTGYLNAYYVGFIAGSYSYTNIAMIVDQREGI